MIKFTTAMPEYMQFTDMLDERRVLKAYHHKNYLLLDTQELHDLDTRIMKLELEINSRVPYTRT